MDKLVSVVVPIYNVEKYLDECILSIVNQTYKNLEIILVDDGSPDNCPKMCDDWAKKDSRIKVVHKENAGLGMARNTGIENSSGDYIFFFDSDDYVDTTVVEKCINSAIENKSDLVIFGRNNVYDDGKIEPCKINGEKSPYKGEKLTAELLPYLFTYELGFGVSAWGKMYNLHTLKKHNLRFVSEREIVSEDAYFSLELFSKIDTVSIVEENLYFYRKREGSLSRKYKEDRQEKNDVFLKKSLEYIKNSGLPEKVGTHVKARYHGMTLGTLMQIQRSDLDDKSKKNERNKIYHNALLRSTLTKEVCDLDYKLPRIFWTVLRFRLYPVCTLLLSMNK